MKSTIFIEYETKNRELDGKILLSSHLLNFGFKSIFMGTAMSLRKEALLHKNGIYFFKSTSIKELSFYKKLKGRGFTLCLLHAEGGVYYKDSSSSIESMFNKKALDFFDYNFVLGSEIQESIEKIHGVEYGRKCYVTGDPRFDLLKPEYNDFFQQEISSKRELFGEFILINTSFSASNPKGGIKALRDYWLSEPSFSQKTKDLLMYKIDFFKHVLDEYLEAIYRLSDENPKLNFIIRPHPSESLEVYKESFKKCENVHVTNDGNVASWILSSRGVIHYDCTTGIESLLANKPVISYTPVIDQNVVAWLPIAVSDNISNVIDLQSAINLIEVGEYNETMRDPQSNQQLENIISNCCQKSPATIADVLCENVIEGGSKDTLMTKILRSKNVVRYNVRNSLKKTLYWLQKRDEVAMSKAGVIRKSEIISKLNSLSAIEEFNFKPSVRVYGEHFCKISLRTSDNN